MKLLTQTTHVLQVLVPVVGALISAVSLIQSRRRLGLFYALTASASLKGMRGGGNLPPEVVRKARAVAEPHLLLVSLYVRGMRDIRAEDFSGGEPLVLGVGARVVMLVRVDAGGATKPNTQKAGNTLLIYPSLLRKGKRLLFYVLVDGSKPVLTCEVSPLADVRPRPAPADEPGVISKWVPAAGIFGAVLTAARYPDGHLTGWPLVGVIASSVCVWILVLVWGGKVIRKLRDVRDLKRRISFEAA
ncbi:hypothetical protein [Streptomyces sp. NPDC005209]|uniref:hypothetical protein n=1 Tax=Streptomyces sp. NPDC005209 TaxID=3156715 RepID=UPI0033A89A83